MIEKQFLVALGALSLALGACSSDMKGTGENGGPGTSGVGNNGSSGASGNTGTGGGSSGASGNTGTGGGAGTSAGAAGTSGAAGASGTGGGGPVDVCVPGVPASSQVPRMLNAQYDNVMRDLLGVTTLAAASNGLPSTLLADDSKGSLTDISWNAYLTNAEKIAGEVMAGANKMNFIKCDPAVGTCLVDTIRSFGRKAFRRPLTDAEVTSFQRLNNLTPKGTPTEVAEAVLYAFLASPSFILLPELAQTQEGTGFKLSSYEVASRLSFMIWGSIPDQILSDAADADQLTTKEQILAQAQRMVQVREKTAPMVASFHRYYADIRLGSHWASIEHDTAKYPNWKSTTNATMMAEVDKFFEEVAFQNGTFKDLFLSPVAYVNSDTAPIYGLPAANYTTALTRVELDPNQRPGFLTRVGFLASFSSGGNTSPILRGAYISKNVLGTKIEDPPPEASKTPVPPGTYTTQRQIVTALTSADMCVGCHASVINPWGFPMEVYDAIGGIQTVDPLGGAIDATSEVELSDGTTQPITAPIELMTLLGTGRDARLRYAQQWVTYTTGRVPNQNDACLVNDLDTKLSSDGYTILNVIADLTQADSFRLRTVGN